MSTAVCVINLWCVNSYGGKHNSRAACADYSQESIIKRRVSNFNIPLQKWVWLDLWLPWAGDDCNWLTLAQCAVSLITIAHVTTQTMASKSSSARREWREQSLIGTCEGKLKNGKATMCISANKKTQSRSKAPGQKKLTRKVISQPPKFLLNEHERRRSQLLMPLRNLRSSYWGGHLPSAPGKHWTRRRG